MSFVVVFFLFLTMLTCHCSSVLQGRGRRQVNCVVGARQGGDAAPIEGTTSIFFFYPAVQITWRPAAPPPPLKGVVVAKAAAKVVDVTVVGRFLWPWPWELLSRDVLGPVRTNPLRALPCETVEGPCQDHGAPQRRWNHQP